jgi:transposase
VARARPRKIEKYGERLKATAVKLSSLPGVLVQDVASALDVHPFMLSLWRKQVREGVIVARASKLDVETTAELRRLRELERRYKVLKEEHELLKKAIRLDRASPRRLHPERRSAPARQARKLHRITPAGLHPVGRVARCHGGRHHHAGKSLRLQAPINPEPARPRLIDEYQMPVRRAQLLTARSTDAASPPARP